jgi:drug/metabolite transporter (DMT)-like permease
MNSRPASSPPHATVALWLVLTTLLWGGSFVFNKIGFREIPPVPFMVLRFSIATTIMFVLCLPRISGLNLDIVKRGCLIGVALGVANLTFVIGVSGTSVSRAGFLNNLFVLIIPLLCLVFWRTRIDRLSILGIVLATLGIIQLAQGGAAGFSRGDIYSTVCALFIATHIILVSRTMGEADVYLITLAQFATVTVVGGSAWLLAAPQPFTIGPVSSAALLYCAVFPTVVCFTIQNTFQRFTTPTQAGLIYTLDPVWSMMGGYLILGERLSGREWAGCALIFGGVALPLFIRRYLETRLQRTYRPGNNLE